MMTSNVMSNAHQNGLSLVNGSRMDRKRFENGAMKFDKLFAVLAFLLTLGVGNVWGANSGLTASPGVFVIDFYNSSKLTATSGTTLDASGCQSHLTVPTGVTASDVVTGVANTGTVRYDMNGGLTLGTSSTGKSQTTLTIGSNYPIRKIIAVGTQYGSDGAPLYVAGTSVTLNTGQTAYASCSKSTTITPSFITSLVIKQNNGSNKKRATLYTAVCEYGYRAYLTAPGTGSISAAPKTTNENGAGWNGTEGAVVGLKYTQKVTLTATPPSGYEVDAWTVKKKSDNSDITASVLSGATLTMPAYDVTVSVTWRSVASCGSAPTISAGSLKGSVSSSSSATAQCTGGITNIGGAGCSLTSYGFAVGTGSNPTIGGTLTTGGATYEVGTSIAASTGFEKLIDGLSASTTYYARPYATNGAGTNYGTQFSFTTLAACTAAPTVTAGSKGTITSTTAAVTCASGLSTLGTGGCSITSYGFVYGTSANPTTSNSTTEVGTSIAASTSFNTTLTDLTEGTTYYVRPYATNGFGTGYGTQTSFSTPKITVSETARAFGDRAVGGSYEMTFTVSGTYLQSDISIAKSGTNQALFSIDNATVTQTDGTAASTTITVTYSPTSAGSHSATLTLTSTNATSKTVSLSGTGKWTVTFLDGNGSTHSTSLVANGSAPSKPGSNPSACDATSTTFMGWTQTAWSGKLAQSAIDAKTAANVKVYTSSDALPAMTNHMTYYPVYAKASGSSTDKTITINTDTLTSYASVNKTIGGITFKSTDNWGKTTWSTYTYLQCKKNSSLYNDDAFPGYIKSVTITRQPSGNYDSNISGTVTLCVGSSKQPSSTCETAVSSYGGVTFNYTALNNYTYLAFSTGGTAATLASINITYTVSSYTYSDYLTTCCTALGSINGSVSFTNPTEAVVSWDNIANVSSWTVKYKIHGAGSWSTTNVGASAPYTKVSSNDSRKCTITGLTCNTAYDFLIIANPADTYCDKEETLDNSGSGYNSGKWDLDYTFSGASLKDGDLEEGSGVLCGDLDIIIQPLSVAYELPSDVTVTIGGNSKTKGTDYTWDSSTGELHIDGEDINGAVAVSCTASLVGCLADPSIGAVSLKTGGTFNLGQVDVTVATSGTGSATCAWIDYGFVWSESANPTVGGSGCTQVPVGSDGSATTWNGSLTKTSFATGTTYYYRAYGKNSKDDAAFVYSSLDGTFTPRSVTFNSNGGSAVATAYVNSGSAVSEPSAPTKTGYTFSKWQLNGEDYDFESAVSANITLDAVWSANTYTVTLAKNYGSAGSSNVTATYDAAMPDMGTKPGREGYIFTGYYDDPDDGEGTKYYNVDKSSAHIWDKATDATLYAHWTPNNYTITLNNEDADDGKGGTESISVTYDSNENLTGTPAITKPVKTGYLFSGYYTAAGGSGVKVIDEDGNVVASASGGGSTYTSATKQWRKAGNVNLYAYWKEVHTVTWYVDGEEWSSGVVTGNTSVVDGEKVSALPTAPTKSDCDDSKRFMGWRASEIDGVSVSNPGGIFTNVAGSPAIDADKTFYAVFADEAGGDFTRVTNVSQLSAGKKVILGYEATANSGVIIPIQSSALNGTLLYTGTTEGSAGSGTLTISSMSAGDEAIYAFTLRAGYNSGYWAFEMSGDNAGKYLGHSGRNAITNFASVQTDDKTDFSIVIGTNDVSTITNKYGAANTTAYKSSGKTTYYNYCYLSYNYNNGNPRAALYKETQTGDFVIYLCNPLTYSNYVTSCASCDADATFTNTTPAVSEIGCTSATLTMEDGLATLGAEGCNISDYGFVIGTSDNPAIGGSGVTKLQVGTSNPTIGADFSYDATGLTKGTHYYVRAYAINKHGTAYSTSTNFWTQNVSSIAITTAPTKTNYIVGETFDPTGMVVTATMASSETEDVTEDVTYSDDALTSGTNKDFAIDYELCETEESVNQKINVYTLSVSEGTNADKGAYSASANIITISSLTTHYTAEFSVTNGSVSSNGDGTYTVTPNGSGNVSVTINYREAAQVKVYYKANGITLTSLTQDVYESETTTLPTGTAVGTAMTSQSVPYPETGYTNFWGWSETDFDATTSEPTLVTGTPTITTSKTYYAVFTNVNKKTIQPSDFNGTYSVNDGEQTYDGVNYNVDNICKQSSKIQFRSYPGYLYSKTALSYIYKIEIADLDLVVNACSDNSGTVDGSAITPSGTGPYVYTFPGNKQYFKITGKGGTDQVSYIDIYYASGTVKYMTYKNYTISLDNEGGSGSSSTTARYKGTLSDVTPPTKAGYSFDGYWNGDNGTGTQLVDEDGAWIASVSTYTDGDKQWLKTADATLYAKWTPVTLTFTGGLYWNSADNWSPACVPTIEHNVIIASNCWVTNANAKAKSVKINFDVRLRIEDNGGLVVAEDIKAQHEADGAYEATKKNDVYIETDVLGTGGLVCGSASTTTEVTYIFYSKSYRYETWYINQYIGIPFAAMDPYDWYGLTIFEYDTEKDKWKTPVLDEDGNLKPFTAYNVISKISGSFAQQYYTEGILNLPGTSGTEVLTCGSRVAEEKADPTYPAHPYFDNKGDYMFANSWTAPISIGAIDNEDISGSGADLVQCIYIFNAGYVSNYNLPKELGESAGQWSAFPIESADYMENAVIQAGQAFLVTSKAANATLTLDYGKHVYTPALNNGINLSPRRAPRRTNAIDDPNILKIVVNTDSAAADKVYLFERSDYTFGYDNGWDGVKIMGSASFPRLYALNGAEKMSVSAVPDVEGIELGFKAGTDTNAYFFSFEYNDSEPLYLYDRETQIFTRINNEASYEFLTNDTDEHSRFVITRSNAPMIETGVGDVKDDVNRAEKFFENNMLFIRRGEKVYNVDGSVVK